MVDVSAIPQPQHPLAGGQRIDPAWYEYLSALTKSVSTSGTVTLVSLSLENGILGSVATATNTPVISLSLGNISTLNVKALNITATAVVISSVSVLNVTATNVTANSIVSVSNLSSNTKIFPGTDAGAGQTAAGIYAGTGAPSNANGNNGDYYFRSDGGATTHLYFKTAGAWSGII